MAFILGLRRLSATLDEMEEKANDSQSEDEDKMESYGEESLRSEKLPTEGSKSNEADEDSIQLGEEGKEFTKGHSFCKQCLHDLQFMKKESSSPNLSKLVRADASCQFKKTRSLCKTVYKMNGF